MLQPRRVAARATAHFMAAQSNDSLGQTIGLQVRFERQKSKATRIMVMTEGVLSRRLSSDVMLDGISTVILDEFHERSLDSDLLLAAIRDIQQVRDDLFLVVMSATMNAKPVSDFLNCPIIECHGKPFPLSIEYRPANSRDDISMAVAAHVDEMLQLGRRGILVFLSGASEIKRCARVLKQKHGELIVNQLYGSLPTSEQDQALQPSKQTRVILSTNIAETSLTIPGVDAVIDAGFAKIACLDAGRGANRLQRQRISRASADQRAGRAARLGPGTVIRMWSPERQATLNDFDLPEIQRVDLCNMLLTLLSFHGPELEQFTFFQEPSTDHLQQALNVLRMIAAINPEHRLTSHGRAITQIPLHPRLASMVIEAARDGQLRIAAASAAFLSEGRIDSSHDFEAQVHALANNQSAPFRVKQAFQQILTAAPRPIKSPGHSGHKALSFWILKAFPDRLCKIENGIATAVYGGRVNSRYQFDRTHTQFAVALDLTMTKNQQWQADTWLPLTWDTLASALNLEVLDLASFDAENQNVIGVRQWRLGELVIKQKNGIKLEPSVITACLKEQIAAHWSQLFDPNRETRNLLSRLQLAAKWIPEDSWPNIQEPDLMAILTDSCEGKRRLRDLSQFNWNTAIRQQLTWEQSLRLDQDFPQSVRVASGSLIRIDYEAAMKNQGLPVLAVKLQEMFGQSETPILARGRLPLILHLLAPNRRPVQVTQDLHSFWTSTYQEVRKELRVRYPKHPWPEDPWTAIPSKHTKKRIRK